MITQILTDSLAQARATVRVFRQTVYYIFSTRWDRSAILQQMYDIGNRSLVFTLITLGFLGAIMSLQAGFQARRIIGDPGMVGQQLLPLLVRQLGPTLGGLMVATRVGTGIAAELGSMVVTEQVDALRMCNADPIDYLVKPRLIASVVMLPVLITFGTLMAFFVAMGVAETFFQTPPAVFAKLDYLSVVDVGEGFFKALAYGVVIPIIAATSGLMARGGSEGVGEATTQAVVYSSLAVIVLDFLIGGVAFLVRL